MADFSINKIQELGDIQRTYTWELIIPVENIPGVKGVNSEDLTLRCRSVSIPGRSNDVITSNFGGMEIHYPGRLKFTQPFTITFEEYADRKIAKMIYEWQQLMFDQETGGGSGKGVKTDVTLKLKNYDGVTDVKQYGSIKIQNAWPESLAEVSLNYSESSAITYSLTLRYDQWSYVNQ